jgi:hypothetical protein
VVGGAERAAGMVGEGSGIAAEREGIAVQMRTILENQKQGDKLQSLLNQMRVYSDSESIFRYNTVAGAASQMLVSKYKPDQILGEMRKLGELAKGDDQLSLVADIFSQAHNQGYVTKGLLTRLQKDAKVPIYSAILEALGKKDNLANESALFKQLRNPTKNPVPVEYLEKDLNILTGPGGALFGHQKEQQQTFAGQLNSLKDRWADVMSGMGGAWNKMALPIMKEVNQISPLAIQKWFDGLTESASKFGVDLAKAFDIEGKAGKLQEIGDRLGSIWGRSVQEVGKLFGVFSNSTTQTTVEILNKIDAGLGWIDTHMTSITTAVKAFVGAWAGLKVLGIAAEVANIGKALSVPALLGGGEAAAGAAVTGVGASLVSPAVFGAAGAAALGYTAYKAFPVTNDAQMRQDILLSRQSANLSKGGPMQSAADQEKAYRDHWSRRDSFHYGEDLGKQNESEGRMLLKWFGDNHNQNEKEGNAWWSGIWDTLKQSSDKEIQAVDKTTLSFDTLHGAVEPTAGSFNRVATAAASVAGALDSLTAKIASWKPPQASPGITRSGNTRILDDMMHDSLRRSYA